MATWQDALKKAGSTKSWHVGMCDQFVAEMWGEYGSGYNTAVDNWNASPGKVQGGQAISQIAPAGALYYWGGGAGHVAISNGDGTVYSTDIGGPGTVTRVPVTEITTKWNKPFLGWTPAFFNGKAPGAPGPTTSSPGGKSAISSIIGTIEDLGSGAASVISGSNPFSIPGDIIDGFKAGTDFLTETLAVFKAFFQPSTYIRMGAGLFGMIFLIAATFFLIREASREVK